MKFKGIIFLWFILIPNSVLGAGAAFLKMDVGAKGYTALADDVSAIYWNPAGLAQINRTELNFMHNDWFSGINYEFLACAYPVENLTFATSLIYLYMDEIKEVNGKGRETGKVFSAEDMALSLACAQRLEENIFTGATFKYIHQGIENESASGFGMDLGILYKPSHKLGLGATIQNLGPRMKFIRDEYSLPLTYRLGVAYRIGDNFTFSLDVKKTKDERLDLGAGLEWWFGRLVALRFSGTTKSNDKLGKFRGLPTGMSAGCGFNIGNSLTLDYAYAPYGDLGDTHRVSISMKFAPKTALSIHRDKPIEIYREQTEEEVEQPKKLVKPKPIKEKGALTARVKMDNITIWQGPGSNYPSIATVSKDTQLLVLETDKQWYYKVMLEDGTIGWICSTFVEW